MFKNQDIRAYAKSKAVRLYEVADKLHISEPTMTRKMRYELPPEEKNRIFKAIDNIAERKAAELQKALELFKEP